MHLSNYPTVEIDSQPDLSIMQDTRCQTPVLDLSGLPPVISDWIVLASKATSAPPDYVLAALLTACAGVTGNRAKVDLGYGWVEPCILWMVLAGKPAQGKTPALKPVINAVSSYEAHLNRHYDLETENYQLALAEANSRKKAWEAEAKKSKTFIPMPKEALPPDKPTRKRLYVQDSTIEQLARIHADNPNGVLQYRDELSGWLGGMTRYKTGSATDEPFWLESWSNGSYTVDRKHLDDPIVVNKVCISVLGGIQPDRLKAIIKGDDTGFSARFLYVWPEPTDLIVPDTLPDEDMLWNLFHRLYYMPETLLTAPDRAGTVFSMQQYCKDKAQQYTGMLSSLYGKASGMGARLALVLALIEWGTSKTPEPPQALTAEQVEWGMTMMKTYFLPMAHRIHESALGTASEGYGRTLARWIMNNTPATINQREIYKVHRIPGLNSAKKAELAINELEEYNWLVPSPDTLNNRKDYIVNQQLWGLATAG